MTTILGTNGNDVLIGHGYDDSILGYGGDDVINASSGNDNIRGGTGNDTIRAGTGFDFVNAGEGNDHIYGDGGNDTILGGDGDDFIDGDNGTDLLYGNAGNDTIYTGTGPDQSWGGDGDDTIIDEFTNGGNEYMNGGNGDDRLIGFGSGGLGPWANRTSYEMYGEAGNDHLRITGGVPGVLDGGDDNDIIELGGYGGSAIGGNGNDKLYAASRENIWDEANWDRESPGGFVIMDGGLGNDAMYGYDYSRETFVFRPGDGRDTIFNFAHGGQNEPEDLIDLTAFGFDMTAEEVIARYAIERDGRTILRFDADSAIVIVGVTPEDLLAGLIV